MTSKSKSETTLVNSPTGWTALAGAAGVVLSSTFLYSKIEGLSAQLGTVTTRLQAITENNKLLEKKLTRLIESLNYNPDTGTSSITRISSEVNTMKNNLRVLTDEVMIVNDDLDELVSDLNVNDPTHKVERASHHKKKTKKKKKRVARYSDEEDESSEEERPSRKSRPSRRRGRDSDEGDDNALDIMSRR